jgi:hypothetical protein
MDLERPFQPTGRNSVDRAARRQIPFGMHDGTRPTLGMIATMFHDFDVAKSRGGYTLIDPHSGTPLVLTTCPQTLVFFVARWR